MVPKGFFLRKSGEMADGSAFFPWVSLQIRASIPAALRARRIGAMTWSRKVL